MRNPIFILSFLSSCKVREEKQALPVCAGVKGFGQLQSPWAGAPGCATGVSCEPPAPPSAPPQGTQNRQHGLGAALIPLAEFKP